VSGQGEPVNWWVFRVIKAFWRPVHDAAVKILGILYQEKYFRKQKLLNNCKKGAVVNEKGNTKIPSFPPGTHNSPW
jgi:hypothetical protein